MKTVTRTFCGLFALCLAAPVVAETVVNIAYLRQEIDRPPVLSNLDAVPEDEGIAGYLPSVSLRPVNLALCC